MSMSDKTDKVPQNPNTSGSTTDDEEEVEIEVEVDEEETKTQTQTLNSTTTASSSTLNSTTTASSTSETSTSSTSSTSDTTLSNESLLESSLIYFKQIQTALVEASEDLSSYKFTHLRTRTPLFVSNGFVTENSRLSIIWGFQYTDYKTKSVKMFKKIRQPILPTFRTEETKIVISLHTMGTGLVSVPGRTTTNELIADFLLLLQKSYPDIRVEKIQPTRLEKKALSALAERKDQEAKAMQYKQVEELETFKAFLKAGAPITPSETTFFRGAGIETESWENDDETSPSLSSDNSAGATLTVTASVTEDKKAQVDGLRLFQDSKLKEQLMIVYNEISKQFQPFSGYVEQTLAGPTIKLRESCFTVTDIEYAFGNWIKEILSKKSIMMQITPVHLQAGDQTWIRFLTDNQLVEIDSNSFGLFMECTLSPSSKVFTINGFFPLFKSTNKRKQDVVNAAIKSFLDAVDDKLREFFRTGKLKSSQIITLDEPSTTISTLTTTSSTVCTSSTTMDSTVSTTSSMTSSSAQSSTTAESSTSGSTLSSSSTETSTTSSSSTSSSTSSCISSTSTSISSSLSVDTLPNQRAEIKFENITEVSDTQKSNWPSLLRKNNKGNRRKTNPYAARLSKTMRASANVAKKETLF